MSLSGWCSPTCGPRAHATCQRRLEAGLLDRYGCPRHGGHASREADE